MDRWRPRRREVRESNLRGDDHCAAHRARWSNRHAVPGLRRQGRSGSHDRSATQARVSLGVRRHLATDDHRESGDRRLGGAGRPSCRRARGRDPRVRRSHRRAAVVLRSHPARREGSGVRDVDRTQGPRTGAANAWSIFSADSARDLVFIPVGSASPDFYGGERLGDNKYANSVVALRASTGAFVWAFQVVHHDLWDYDVPAQPVLFTLRRAGISIPAVAIGTKMGHVFVLDRRDGKPLFPVEERPVPPSDVPGEKASPTQPFPPPAFRLVPESLSVNDAFGVTDSARASCRARIAALRFQGIFTPPSQQGTIIWPGNLGGVNWSGVSVDEQRGLLVAPMNRLAMVVRSFRATAFTQRTPRARTSSTAVKWARRTR